MQECKCYSCLRKYNAKYWADLKQISVKKSDDSTIVTKRCRCGGTVSVDYRDPKYNLFAQLDASKSMLDASVRLMNSIERAMSLGEPIAAAGNVCDKLEQSRAGFVSRVECIAMLTIPPDKKMDMIATEINEHNNIRKSLGL